MEKLIVTMSAGFVFSMESTDMDLTEEKVEHDFHEVHSVEGTLKVNLTNGSVIYVTAEELGNVVKCLGILEQEKSHQATDIALVTTSGTEAE
jgi:hypothetical protein